MRGGDLLIYQFRSIKSTFPYAMCRPFLPREECIRSQSFSKSTAFLTAESRADYRRKPTEALQLTLPLNQDLTKAD
jgi:hypothetical protein